MTERTVRIARGLVGWRAAGAAALVAAGLCSAVALRAQQDPNAVPQVAPVPQGGPMMRMGGPAGVAASGEFVYVVRGGTLYQFRAADLSLAKQADLPRPAGPPPAPPAPAPPAAR